MSSSHFTIVETASDTEGISHQILLLPDQVWVRITDGQTKGHTFRWNQVSPSQLLEDQLPFGQPVTATGSAKFTPIDADLCRIGRVSQTATKALRELQVVDGPNLTPELLEHMHLTNGELPPQGPQVSEEIVEEIEVTEPVVIDLTDTEAPPTSIGYIPPTSIGERYVSQTVHGVDLMELFQDALDNNESVRLEGPTGCGKTMAVEAFCARNNMELYTVNCSADTQPSTLFGSMVDLGIWQNGLVTQGILASQERPVCILIDELSLLMQRLVGPILPLLNRDQRFIRLLDHDGRIIQAGTRESGGGLLLVATMNNGYAGNVELNEALRRRFDHVVHMNYSREVESQLVGSKALLSLVYEIRNNRTDYRTDIGTDWLVSFEKFVARRGLDYAIGNFRDHFHEHELSSLDQLIARERSKLLTDFNLTESEESVFADIDGLQFDSIDVTA